jgi:hypothetical protein
MRLQDSFAIGNVFINPTSGLLPANPSPFELKTITDISLDYKGKNVELRGQYLVPVDARIADVSFSGKFTIGTTNLNQLNNLIFAGTLNTSNVDDVYPDEPHTVPSSGPYTVTVTNAAEFVQDLGVSYALTSGQFELVNSVTQQGQYSVNATTGVYTFDSADAASEVVISYVADNGTGNSLIIPNNLQGQSPQFELVAWIPGNTDSTASYTGYRFFNCRATSCKILDVKNNSFRMVEVDFSVYCPINQNIGEIIQSVV